MDIKKLLKHNKRPRTRTQSGMVFKKRGVIYLRFYVDRLTDGKPERVRVAEQLHAVDDLHYIKVSRKRKQTLSPDLDELRAKRMAQVNKGVAKTGSSLLIADFWEDFYLPWTKEEGLAASTILGYKKIWNAHLSTEFEGETLAKYTTPDAYNFLVRLRKKLGRHALAHVRTCASGIFAHAINVGQLKTGNPWSGVKQPSTPKPKKGHAYSVEESFAILSAIQRTDGKLLFALCAFEGLRPSEAAGLKWEDIDGADQYLVVTQAVVSGVAGDLKTEDTSRRLLLIEPVRSLIGAWRKQCGGASTGYLFHGRGGRPLDTNSFAKHVIVPDVRAAKLEWYGLYAGRRGVATTLTKITGDLNAAYATLGNSYEVVARNYTQPLEKSSDAGMKRLEQEHAK